MMAQMYSIDDLMQMFPDNKKLVKVLSRKVKQCPIWGDGQAYDVTDAIALYLNIKRLKNGAKSTNKIAWPENEYNVIRAAYGHIKTAVKAAEGKLNDGASWDLAYIDGKYTLVSGEGF